MGDDSLYSYTVEGTNTVDYYGYESWDTSNTGNNQYHVYINNDNKGDVTRILDDVRGRGGDAHARTSSAQYPKLSSPPRTLSLVRAFVRPGHVRSPVHAVRR